MSKNWNKGEEITAEGLNDQGLKVSAQDTPGLTVKIAAGVAIVDGTIVKYAGGNSPTISAPAANPRIDLIAINSSGVISVVAGSENASPSAPAYPSDKTVLAEIYCKVGMTQIVNNDATGKGYIYRDSRPLGAGISLIDVSTGSADAGKGTKTNSDGLLSDTFLFDGFGDGNDGSITLNGSTDYSSAGFGAPSSNIYTMTRDVYCTALTINNGITLRPAGYRIYVQGTLTNNGTIEANGGSAGSAANDTQTGVAGGTAVPSGFFKHYAGGNGGNGGSSGNDGQTGGTTGTPTNSLGGKGGNTYRGGGRNDTSNNAATGPTPTAPNMRFGTSRFLLITGLDLNITTYAAMVQTQTTGAASAGTAHTHQYDSDKRVLIPFSGGAGGAGGGGGHGYTDAGYAVGAGGGGGGAGGGVIFIACKTWAGNGAINALGGNGGPGVNRTSSNRGGGGSGGGGGGGGFIIVIYAFKTYSGTTSAAGGTGGAAGTQTAGGSNFSPSAGDNGGTGTVKEVQIGKRNV
jgi:hypothetical protein